MVLSVSNCKNWVRLANRFGSVLDFASPAVAVVRPFHPERFAEVAPAQAGVHGHGASDGAVFMGPRVRDAFAGTTRRMYFPQRERGEPTK
jgi:hypothetical protein